MKNLFLVLLISLFTVPTVLSQNHSRYKKDTSVQWYVAVAVDGAMALSGPYAGKPNDIGTTLNMEFRLGVEKVLNGPNGFRAGIQYEIHPAIYYEKFVIGVDYMLKDHLLWFPLDNFNQYAGVEFGPIWRGREISQEDGIHHSTALFNPGVNIELQYMITDNFGVGMNLNAFRAESALTKYGKQVRWDSMVSAVVKF